MPLPPEDQRIDDGFSTIVSFELRNNVKFYEKSVTPPGFADRGPNDTTTMRNVEFTSTAPKKLKSLTGMTFVAAYAVAAYNDIAFMIQKNQKITVTFATGAKRQFWGYLAGFVPNETVEGAQPTATVTITPTMQDRDGNPVGFLTVA